MPVTNILESLHMQLRKIIKNRGHFPSDEAATKLLWLALRNITNGQGTIDPGMERGDESVRRALWGPVHHSEDLKQPTSEHKISDTPQNSARFTITIVAQILRADHPKH
jgi:hypothetical protein